MPRAGGDLLEVVEDLGRVVAIRDREGGLLVVVLVGESQKMHELVGDDRGGRLLGHKQVIDLARPGSEANLRWLLTQHRSRLQVEIADLSDGARLRSALADAISQLPDFMRRANTTFVNLRATLDDLTPLVNESKPVAKKLRPFLDSTF